MIRHSITVIDAFQGGTDGANPDFALIADGNGNMYGTTGNGGKEHGSGYGTVFKLAPDGTKTTLYIFKGGRDGANPGGLIIDAAGNLYGTTNSGGGSGCGGAGCGTVFKVASDGTETVLYKFAGGPDGENPDAKLLMDKQGNLYGTTYGGGTDNHGTVFELAPGGTETILYSFSGSSDGGHPTAGLIMGKYGVLFGATSSGGDRSCGSEGCGTIYSLTADGTETALHTFEGDDGQTPISELIADRKGNLYGVASAGGANAGGVVFKLAPDGTYTVLHEFCSESGCPDGRTPNDRGGLAVDTKGHLVGTTFNGGSNFTGVVFKIKE